MPDEAPDMTQIGQRARLHENLKMTPAMTAGICDRLRTLGNWWSKLEMKSHIFTGSTEAEAESELSGWLAAHETVAVTRKHTTTTYPRINSRTLKLSGEIMSVAITIQYEDKENSN